MDFRFAGFVSASLFAHLALLLAGAEPLTPKIGGEAAALSITLITKSQPAPHAPAPQLNSVPGRPHLTPARVATAASRQLPVAAPAHRFPAAPATASSPKTPARRMASASAAAAAAPTALRVSEQISAALQNQLAEKFSYPWLARKRGWQGHVTLSLHVGENGNLSRWKVARTSGYQVLDRSALDSAKRIRNLPEAAGLLNGTALDLLVPVHYRLLDS